MVVGGTIEKVTASVTFLGVSFVDQVILHRFRIPTTHRINRQANKKIQFGHIYFLLCVCSCMHVCATFVQMPTEARKGVSGSCELPSVSLELNWSSPQEACTLF